MKDTEKKIKYRELQRVDPELYKRKSGRHVDKKKEANKKACRKKDKERTEK